MANKVALFFLLCHGILEVRGQHRKLGTSSAIPEELIPCYNNNAIEDLSEFPQTPRILIELLGKFERHKSEPSLKDLSNWLLHKVKFDGIERIVGVYNVEVPYRAVGKQFFKYKLISDHLTPSPSYSPPNFADGNRTLCLLHSLLSNRFDSSAQRQRLSQRVSFEQKGAILTKWGTVSPGFLIAGLATALNRDYISLHKLIEAVVPERESNVLSSIPPAVLERPIDNLLVSTIGGILAEVVLNQATLKFRLTAKGSWNDTLYPDHFYFPRHYWDSNDALLLGAVDALVICNGVASLQERYPKMRLSQLMDMYYSDRGMFFDPTIKACDRKSKFNEAWKDFEFEPPVATIANLLQSVGYYGTTWTNESVLDDLSNLILPQFKADLDSLFLSLENCVPGQVNACKRSEVILIMDQFNDRHEFKRLLALIADELDVSLHGSKLGLINGNDGTWISNVNDQTIDLFRHLHATKDWPLRLSLDLSLKAVISYYQNKTATSKCDHIGRPYSQAIIIFSRAMRLSEADRDSAKELLQTILLSHPETKILFVASEEHQQDYNEIVHFYPGNCRLILTHSNIANIAQAIGAELKGIPASIINIYCENLRSEFEDYLTPGEKAIYQIHSSYNTQRMDIGVKFKGFFYGELSICALESGQPGQFTCKEITDNDEVTFYVRDHCITQQTACSVRFEVSPKSSKLRCTEYDCRYPDQIRLQVSTYWNTANIPCITMWQLVMVVIISPISSRLLSFPSL